MTKIFCKKSMAFSGRTNWTKTNPEGKTDCSHFLENMKAKIFGNKNFGKIGRFILFPSNGNVTN